MTKEVVLFGIGPKDAQEKFARIFAEAGIKVTFGLQFAFPRDKDLEDWKVERTFTEQLERSYSNAISTCPDPDNATYTYLDIEHSGFIWQTASSGLSPKEQLILSSMLSAAQRRYPTLAHSFYDVPHILRSSRLDEDKSTLLAMETTRSVINKCDVLYPTFYPSTNTPEEDTLESARRYVERVVQGVGWYTENTHDYIELVPMFWTGWTGTVDFLFKYSLTALTKTSPDIKRIAIWANLTSDRNASIHEDRIRSVLPYIKEWANG